MLAASSRVPSTFDISSPMSFSVSSTTKFAISFARSEPLPITTEEPPSSPSSTMKPTMSSMSPVTSAPSQSSSTTSYTLPIYEPTHIPGLWKSGQHHVLSVEFPLVQHCLKLAETSWTLPQELQDTTLRALVALAVFGRPTHPAHWLLWGSKQVDATLELTHRVINAKNPPLIRYFGALPDMFTLYLWHSKGWHEVIRSKLWYSQLAQKQATAPSGPQTRKRHREPLIESISGVADADVNLEGAAVTKRPRMQTRWSAQRKAVTPPDTAETHSSTTLQASGPLKTAESIFETPPASQRPSTRQSRSAKPVPAIESVSTSSTSSSSSSVLSQSPSPVPRTISSSISRFRNRSNSQISSETLIASDRSLSVASTRTATETPESLNVKDMATEEPVKADLQEEFVPSRITRSKGRSATQQARTSKPSPYTTEKIEQVKMGRKNTNSKASCAREVRGSRK
ncbi:uncharacterized protein EV420DRAFT_1640705 [Desarmillaria tabescens]|uniref:Uncharacterized protein n=1 Tax=Armillaria tabescens TaxID=1929756 RepID=A0AA39N8X7_ARMTA|nr:uncharacterized protein EV420DRAFT_1640705 [Desarmillaria tabescens]KAK0461212.1 hypothetical protein EV420DRAFT_1640705 [Desarmillaria tabescens]